MNSELELKFKEFWNADSFLKNNPYEINSPIYWAWEGYVKGVKETTESIISLHGDFKWQKI